MKKNTLNYMYLIGTFLIITLKSNSAQAEKITVKKIKGKQAVVEMSSPLEEGQTYELVPDSVSQDVDYKTDILSSRRNSLTLGGQFDFLKSDSYQSNGFSLQVRYGWNFSSLEIGTFADVNSDDKGAGATTTISGGGYFDYNLIPNRDPKKIVYGAFSLLGIGSTAYPSSSTSGGSSTTLQTNLGGFISYFIGATSTAIRGELYGSYQQVNTSAQQNSLIGAGARGLLVFYF